MNAIFDECVTTYRKLVDGVPGNPLRDPEKIGTLLGASSSKFARFEAKLLVVLLEQPTGLAPEFVRFNPNGGGMRAGAFHNLLRPEAIESVFYLWRFTKEAKYREMGWKMFLAFERYCRIESGGYAGLKNVASTSSAKDDTMQTFWLAETLKYFLMLFSDDSLLDLDTHVINTEAHPLRVLPD